MPLHLLPGADNLSGEGEWKKGFCNSLPYDGRRWLTTCGSDAVGLIMQEDCNLVMYNKSNRPKWASDTYTPGSHVCHLQLSDDGKLQLHTDGDWGSRRQKHR
uniref:Bulb-type lectin domain-containing protein n=1 Tax=Cyprinodon variegatus TaxID=28743 RepID=A0A3Q2DV96_CYPVA